MSHKDTARKVIEGHSGALVDLSRWMYEHPEIAFEEREASARLSEFLRETALPSSTPPMDSRPPLSPKEAAKGPKSSSAPSTTPFLAWVMRAVTTSLPRQPSVPALAS